MIESDYERGVETAEDEVPEDDESRYIGGFKTGALGNDIYESKVKKLGDVLGRPYIVPDYQRAYTWKTKSADDLWHDLTRRYLENEKSETDDLPSAAEYLLGPVVFSKNDKEHHIVDGQQRLVTLTLLFCAIRDAVNTFNENRDEPDRALFKAFARNINKIAMNENNDALIELNTWESNVAYRHIVTGNPPRTLTDNIKKDQAAGKLIANYKKLLRNATEFCGKLELEATGVKLIDRLDQLEQLTADIKNKNVFVHISIDDDMWAPHVFESLNGKADPLTQSALIKSYLLHTLKVGSDDAGTFTAKACLEKWNALTNKFQAGTGQSVDDFLFESALSRRASASPTTDGVSRFYQDNITKKHIYGYLKRACKTKNDVRIYIDHLDTDLENVTYVLSPDTLPVAYPTNIKHALASVDLLKANYIRRPIIAACRKWGIKHSHTIALTNFLHQYFFVDVKVMERKIDSVKQKSRSVVEGITAGKSLEEILNDHGIFNPVDLDTHDQKFKEGFAKKFSNPIRTPDMAKYVFLSIERHLRPDPEISASVNEIELEHIFPRKPYMKDDGWSNTDLSDKFLDRLGNLTILTPPYNKDVANKGFLYKKGNPDTDYYCYAKSELAVNRNYLMRYNAWNEEQLLNREKLLCDIASEVWRLTRCLKRARLSAQN